MELTGTHIPLVQWRFSSLGAFWQDAGSLTPTRKFSRPGTDFERIYAPVGDPRCLSGWPSWAGAAAGLCGY